MVALFHGRAVGVLLVVDKQLEVNRMVVQVHTREGLVLSPGGLVCMLGDLGW